MKADLLYCANVKCLSGVLEPGVSMGGVNLCSHLPVLWVSLDPFTRLDSITCPAPFVMSVFIVPLVYTEGRQLCPSFSQVLVLDWSLTITLSSFNSAPKAKTFFFLFLFLSWPVPCLAALECWSLVSSTQRESQEPQGTASKTHHFGAIQIGSTHLLNPNLGSWMMIQRELL